MRVAERIAKENNINDSYQLAQFLCRRSISQQLKDAWSAIDQPDKWCQGHFIQCFGDKTKRTSYGALYEGHTDTGKTIPILRSVMGGDINEFNDTHTYEEVRDAWMEAIRLAEEDGE